MSLSGRLVALAALFLAAFLGAGCGGGTELDYKSLEETLPHDLRPVAPEPIKSADCPSGIDVEKGKTFSCEVTFKSGKKTTVHLRLTDAQADYEFLSFSSNK